MKKFLKILLWTIVSIFALIVIALSVFMYKVKNGFPVSYETEIPSIDFPQDRTNVLLFSKATGFRHGESIEAGKKVFDKLAKRNNWFLYSTEEGGVFNPDQLARFDAVIFNNSTGRVLNEEQQKTLEAYVGNGGKLIGIHGSGDDSHHWDWYEQNFVGAKFSHHPMNPQLQEATLIRNGIGIDSALLQGLPSTWQHTDEWYVFYKNPHDKGFNVLYEIDGEKIISNGNFLWIRDKDFGMGKKHPVAWYRVTGKGRTFYTSIGHDAAAWKQEPFVRMLENAVKW
ncbi:ThuA domain-containing protein [Chryseolinea sp. H1M3-3]|uniref:ThuA domain-containing protein n=1 Tax=Chryseolinea sp. H1M3-3 TaxID=3034144 RepID=UPI0023EDD313|nr:ThuA domain-containing protein [Chryseolinea sp. H1M3-3]